MRRLRVLDSDFWFAAVMLWMLGWFFVGIALGATVGVSNATYELLAAIDAGPFLIAAGIALIRAFGGDLVAAWRKAGRG